MFDDERSYQVTVSERSDISIWPADRELPVGWTRGGFEGSKSECLNYIADSSGLGVRAEPTTARRRRSAWLVGRPDQQVVSTLYCFAHSGGSVGEFLRWSAELAGISVQGIQLPGRGQRLAEASLTSVSELVTSLVAEQEFESPFVLFGHSLGSLLAFETARELRRQRREMPSALVLSSYRAAHLARETTALHTMPDRELLAEIDRRYGGLPPQLWDEPDVVELSLPAYRADFTALETHEYKEEPPLAIPLYVVGGDSDTVSRTELAQWYQHTTAPFHLHTFAGGHFYFRDDPAALLRVLRAATTTGRQS